MPKWVKSVFKVAKDTVQEFFKDNCLNVAAAIAYYTLQSIIPLILGIIVFVSFFLQEGEARNNFINAVKGALPNSTFDVGKIIDDLVKSAPGLLSISGIFLLWSGSGIFDQLIFGINVAYDVKKDNRNFFVKLILRFGLLLIVGVLVAASFVVTILSQLLFSAKVSLLGISPGNFSFLLPVISFVLPILLMFCVFMILYKLAPDRKGNKWSYVAIGALVAAVLFELLKYGFTFYVTAFNASDSYTKSYGALGGVLLFLLYIWLSAAVMLLGAEVASVLGGWKSAMEGPASQQDPGLEVEAEKLDSEGGPVVTEQEKATGEAQPVPATQAEGKEGSGKEAKEGKPGEAKPAQPADKAKAPEKAKERQPAPVPALAASTTHPRTLPNMIMGGLIVAAAFVTGIIFKRKDPVM